MSTIVTHDELQAIFSRNRSRRLLQRTFLPDNSVDFFYRQIDFGWKNYVVTIQCNNIVSYQFNQIDIHDERWRWNVRPVFVYWDFI